jgi:exodeoxyribonuclease VII large subunit
MRLRRGREASRLESLSFRLTALSPLTVLARGYAIVTGDGGRVLTHAQSVRLDEPIRVRLHQGVLHARVVEPEEATLGAQAAITPTDLEP